MTHLRLNLHAAWLAAGLLAATPALYAQAPEEQSPDPAPQETPEQMPPDMTTPDSEASTAQIDDTKVDQFANAYVEVQAIQAQAAQELNTTTDAAKVTEVRANAERQMIAAVERSGLQVEEFNRIADLMTTDVSLRSRVIDKVQKRSKG